MNQTAIGPFVPESLYLATFTPSPDPTAPKRLERFTKTIHWLWQTTTQSKFLWRGEVIAEWGTCWDFKGFLSSIPAQLSDTRLASDDHKPEGCAVIIAETTLTATPVLLKPQEARHIRWKEFPYEFAPNHWYTGDEEMFDRIAAFDSNADREEGQWAPWNQSLQPRKFPTVRAWTSDEPVTDECAIERFLSNMPEARVVWDLWTGNVEEKS